ncbi:tau 95 subunit of transcription factor TFIIIC [Ceratobasidium sp. 414]|nr:tau 95 subunit of transcription factor TFIIIC [Ceratobasidium sp. 414]
MASDLPPSSPPLPALQDLLQSTAGPSANEIQPDDTQLDDPLPASITDTPQTSPAQNIFYSVEYPGYVQPLPSSTAHAIRTLGGPKSLGRAFGEGGRILELQLQPDNPFAHPVTGDVVATNKLLVKVVIRRKKKPLETLDGTATRTSATGASTTDKGKGKEVETSAQGGQSAGTYTAEIVGVIPKTVRFRSMADFQYQPDEDDYIVQMRRAMDRLNVDTVRSFDFEPLEENYGTGQPASQNSTTTDPDRMEVDDDPTSSAAPTGAVPTNAPKSQLKLIPPPLFSRQGIAQHYKYVHMSTYWAGD